MQFQAVCCEAVLDGPCKPAWQDFSRAQRVSLRLADQSDLHAYLTYTNSALVRSINFCQCGGWCAPPKAVFNATYRVRTN